MNEFGYELPEERIAKFPLAERDQSKLLVADAASQSVSHHRFFELASLLPEKALLVRNDTKVIAARLHLAKSTGGLVELLCLDPVAPSVDPAIALSAKRSCRWNCLIGGRKIERGSTLRLRELVATVLEKSGAQALVEFAWQTNQTFAELLDEMGKMPIPPYLKRDANTEDKTRYQTVYAIHQGSVAAPTAGLHFTERVFQQLANKQIQIADLTLHVGLGTFKPVESDTIAEHQMHVERIAVPLDAVEALLAQAAMPKPCVVAVGTTSMRTLESLYWFGAKLCLDDGDARKRNDLWVSQWDSYRLSATSSLPSLERALNALLEWATRNGLERISGETQLIIAPSYEFKVVDALITNFHQPRSTLILLVAAFLGDDFWRVVYQSALDNGYRFLSYGDSSLLWRKKA
ncbi:MAG: S-adenosylmethionine:tRNA ribosyltransferase-isomerase [Chloroherpetonaceae bacterium]|nr:S-adenosylmethionine:tRNA ribosyltransferase-isomerase [Chloroherpetonaceae bacterium]